jgi:hypothetical protein
VNAEGEGQSMRPRQTTCCGRTTSTSAPLGK